MAKAGRTRIYKVFMDEAPCLHFCAHKGCNGKGLHLAPEKRLFTNPTKAARDVYTSVQKRPERALYFCEEHIREYNRQWNYFDGMDEREAEHFLDEVVIGHRPTWKVSPHLRTYQDEVERTVHEYLYGSGESRKEEPRTKIEPEEKQALTVLGLSFPVSLKDVKTRYKELAKRFHPDMNGGGKEKEETLKTINHAYSVLKTSTFLTV